MDDKGQKYMTTNLETNLKNIYSRQSKRNIACVVFFVVIIAILGIFMMTIGNTNYSLREVIRVLLSDETKGAAYTIKSLRLPKLIVGGLAGFSFGLAGYTFQNLLRNPLASPDIIGVTAGSSAAAVFCILILGISGAVASVFSVVAGLLVTGLILLLSGKGKAFSSRIGFQAVLNALISWMLLVGSEYDVGTALRWLRGSLNPVQMSDVPAILIMTLFSGGALLFCNKELRIMQLGDEYATTLGASINLIRICCLICALLLSSVATAATGPIASVAFLSGPIATRLTKNGSIAMLTSGLVGTIIVYASELIGKNLFETSYPVGVITGLLGAPYLLLLLLNINKKGEKI